MYKTFLKYLNLFKRTNDPQANVNVNFRVIATYHSIDYKLKRHRIKIRWKKFHDLIPPGNYPKNNQAQYQKGQQ